MAPKKNTDEPVAVPAEDVNMEDSPLQEDREDIYDPSKIKPTDNRIRVLPGSTTPFAASFEFRDEDHTLGNALRYIIMKNPNVEFCGYSIPHPSEPLMNIRIQTYEPCTAIEALEQGFTDLADLCEVVADRFVEARDEFASAQMET